MKRSRRCGLTLIELMAGMTLLGTLLVSLLLARGQHLRQWTAANQRLEAVAAADALLSQWWQNPAALPRHGSGVLGDDQKLAWRTQVISNDAAQDLSAQVVRLEIVAAEAPASEPPLVAVEVVVAHEDPKRP